MMRLGLEQSTVDIARVEKSFLARPKTSYGFRKPLPPLPPMAEFERDVAEAVALENRTRAAKTSSRIYSPARGGPWKELRLPPLSISSTKSPRLQSMVELGPTTTATTTTTTSTKRMSFTSIDPKRILKYGAGKYSTVELSPQPSEDPNDPLVRTGPAFHGIAMNS